MKVELDNLVSMKEANQNFSKVARMVVKDGAVVILKNNIPKYILVDYNLTKEVEKKPVKFAEDNELEMVSSKILKKYKKTFEELAKWFFCPRNK